jgi:hypothetical protein
MLIQLLRVIGWLAVVAGVGVVIICVAMLFGRSPADNEGMIVGAALGTIVLIALPTFVVGTLILAFTNCKKAKSGAT